VIEEKKYPILFLTKDDLYEEIEDRKDEKELTKKIDNLTDDQMKYLARKLGELYCETDYWTTLFELFKELKVVKA